MWSWETRGLHMVDRPHGGMPAPLARDFESFAATIPPHPTCPTSPHGCRNGPGAPAGWMFGVPPAPMEGCCCRSASRWALCRWRRMAGLTGRGSATRFPPWPGSRARGWRSRSTRPMCRRWRWRCRSVASEDWPVRRWRIGGACGAMPWTTSVRWTCLLRVRSSRSIVRASSHGDRMNWPCARAPRRRSVWPLGVVTLRSPRWRRGCAACRNRSSDRGVAIAWMWRPKWACCARCSMRSR